MHVESKERSDVMLENVMSLQSGLRLRTIPLWLMRCTIRPRATSRSPSRACWSADTTCFIYN